MVFFFFFFFENRHLDFFPPLCGGAQSASREDDDEKKGFARSFQARLRFLRIKRTAPEETEEEEEEEDRCCSRARRGESERRFATLDETTVRFRNAFQYIFSMVLRRFSCRVDFYFVSCRLFTSCRVVSCRKVCAD